MSSGDGKNGADLQRSREKMSDIFPVSSESASIVGHKSGSHEAGPNVNTVVKETTTVSHSQLTTNSNAHHDETSVQSKASQSTTRPMVTNTVQTSTSVTTSKATASSSVLTAAVQNADTSSTSQIIANNSTADQDALMEYDADDDGGVIRCICECDDDDGFTIQCDKCLVWQHCACFGMSQASVPDEYHCEQCDPRPVDVEFAKEHQQRRREAELKKASLERSARRQNSANAAALATYNETMISDTSMDGLQQMDASKGQLGNSNLPGGINRSRKPSQQLDLTNVTFASVEGPSTASATPGVSKANRKKGSALKSGGGGKRSSTGDMQGMAATTSRGASLLASSQASLNTTTTFRGSIDDRLDFDDLSDRLEAWQVEYTPITQNLIIEESMLATMMTDFIHTNFMKADRGTGNRMIAPVLGKKVKTLINLNVADDATKSFDQDASSMLIDTKEELIGLTAIGDECAPIELFVADLAICTQRTYVKQISELASASIFNSLLQINTLPSEPQRPWSANRIFNKPVMHGLFADVSIPAGCFIQEYVGEICKADHYRRDAINQYHQIGASKPSVHLFPPPLNICIDARRYGNTCRFARFSCHPNTVLRPIVLANRNRPDAEESETLSVHQSSSHRSDQIKFGLFAISDIPRTHEITLGWEWDDAHVVHILPQLVRNPLLGILDTSSSLSLSTSTRGGKQRALERERRHAAVTALVGKGDFPYSGTSFSQKMNSVLTVLLSSCLCACIGSASAPSGTSSNTGGSSNSSNNSASSNNMKRQDCAISQMLRLSQGMNLLNVHIPGSSQATGKSNRKSKAPDFEPLVGKRRWWRPDAMPLTPRSSEGRESPSLASKDDFYRDLDVPFKIAPGGRVGRVEEVDFEKAMKRQEINARMKKLRQDMDMDVNGDEENEIGNESDASSVLTEPLARDSEQEEEEDDDDGDDSLLLDDNNVTIAKDEKGASFLTRTALPPKKRISGTRLKAVLSGEENSDIEYKGKRKRNSDGKTRLIREERRDSNQRKKKKKKKKYHEQSSPLTSAPSDLQSNSEESDDDASQDITPTPPSKKKMTSNRSEKSKRSGRLSEEGRDEGDKVKKAELKAKKKALLIKKRRIELLGEFDEEASDVSADVPPDESNGHKEHPNMSSPVKIQARKKNPNKAIVYSDDEEDRSVPEVIDAQKEVAVGGLREEQRSAVLNDDNTSMSEADHTTATTVAPPPPPIEVPKAKLSLADYKKRLAERRTTSANSQGIITTPLATPGQAVQSPEKASQPNTPLSTIGPVGGFAFPAPLSSALPLPSPEVIMTPTIPTPLAEFAPPPPRFPRPMTPPRSVSGSVTPFAIATAPRDSPSSGKNEVAPIDKASQQSVSTSVAPVPPAEISNVSTDATMVEKDVDTNINAAAPVEATSALSIVEMDTPIKIEEAVEDVSTLDKKEPVTNAISFTNVSNVTRPRAASTTITAIDNINPAASFTSSSTTTTFNPPKAPRALINPSALPVGSPPTSAAVSTVATAAVSPPPATKYDQRQGQMSISYEGLHPTSMRNLSPTRPSLASPISSFGGSYSSQIAGQSSLVDFANVPKGPARMRERERGRDVRDREIEDREFREPLPPLRDRERDREREYEWDRERERERLERERDRDYMMRDPGYQSDPYRDRDYNYDRRRMMEEEEEDRIREYNASRQPLTASFVPRGGARGSYQGTSRGGAPAWSGRARTRGRGSRGGSAWR